MRFVKHALRSEKDSQPKTEGEAAAQAVSPEEWRRIAMAMSWSYGMFPCGYGIWYFY